MVAGRARRRPLTRRRRAPHRDHPPPDCAPHVPDRIARLAGVSAPLQLIPFRILRFLLKPERRHLVRSIVHPIPDPGAPQFGVHATRRFDGQVEVGPGIALAFAREAYNATTVHLREVAEMLRYRGFWNMVVKKPRVAFAEARRASSLPAMVRDLQRILPELTTEDLVREPAADGVLAQLRSHFFDLLILDLDLSGGSAAPLLAQLCDQWADLPVLLLTGGVKDGRLPPAPPKSSVLPKPFQINQLHSRIQELLGR